MSLVGSCWVLVVFSFVSGAVVAQTDPDSDWKRRAHAPGVVKAVGFDDPREWALYAHDRSECRSDYQVRVDGRVAGCRSNAWDSSVKASGKGSVRFDVLPQSGQGGGGALAISFGDYATSQFGANDEFWVSWRQRMDARYLQAYRREGGGTTTFKQVIIAQGDMPLPNSNKVYPGNACSEAQVVIVSSNPSQAPTYPVGYIECGRYIGFDQTLTRAQFVGDPRGSRVITSQNMRRTPEGLFNCIGHPSHLDRSGCFTYRPNEWTTYMVHLKLGPEGRASSSIFKKEQPGYVDSTYELYAAAPNGDFELLHRQTGLVIPKGQYYVGGDPMARTSYKPGWGPGDAHPQAKFGKLWLLSYMSFKDPTEVTDRASTWYDEIIISRCRIAAPGRPAPSECKPSTPAQPTISVSRAPPQAVAGSVPGSSGIAKPSSVQDPGPARAQTHLNQGPSGLPRISEIPAPGSKSPREGSSPLTQLQIAAVLQNLKPGHWFEFPRSELARVQIDACKSRTIMQQYAEHLGKEFPCNPDHLMAYSGGAYDSKRHRLLVWGGGHAGYGGNEVYAFDVSKGAWLRMSDPMPAVLEYRFDHATNSHVPYDPPWHDPAYPPAPVSVHSYDQLEFLPEQDSMLAVGGSAFGPGYPGNITWLFDAAGGTGWRQGQRVWPKNGELMEFNASTAYDPISKRVLMRGYSAAAAFDPVAGTWKVTRRRLPTRGLGTVGELDPKRRVFVVIGGDRREFYEIGPNGEFLRERKLVTKGATEIEKCYAPGLTYDIKAERIVAWCSGGDIYTLDVDTGLWVRHAAKSKVIPGDPAKTVGIRGTFGRFRYMPEYNAYVLANGTRNNAFIYRLEDGSGVMAH